MSFLIENPILNSPFEMPSRHFKVDEDGITEEVVPGRRPSSYFIPIPRPRKHTKQLTFDAEWTEERCQNEDVNYLRSRVNLWRDQGSPGITPTSRTLLQHWQSPDRERRLFFCQIEALETIIYLNEAAEKRGDVYLTNRLRDLAVQSGTTLFRQACKMATGAGKTAVMGMIIAWQTLNKAANPIDRRFTDAFLLVAPGITIRDRLRVLLPSDPENHYQALDLVPADLLADLSLAKIVITNYHTFKLRELGDAGRLTKTILAGGQPSAFVETPDQMVRRVCRDLGIKKQIVVLNDEAHHCYRARPAQEKLTGEERREAEDREEAARLWITGLEAIDFKIGIKTVYDLSATPFYLKGSGYPEGTLFPWVVCDFSLIDAIESGIVKIPRVPIADNTLGGHLPTYRNLWQCIREHLPTKAQGTEFPGAQPQLPKELEGALRSLYSHYELQYQAWARDPDALALGRTPPVFIIICNNTSVSKLVFDWIAGRETGHHHPDNAPLVAPGNLPAFSNAEHNRWLTRPNTILVDSRQLESGEGMSADFKKLLASEIEQFKAEDRQRYPGRDADRLTDEDLMREVLNTVGKPGKLGEVVRCVVSVSMLTEGWDVNTVTHILGVRAFGTQLLCEQVIGRGLRRRSYTLNDQGRFDPEYAEVYGVPFAFIPCAGTLPEEHGRDLTPRPARIRAIPERAVRFPWVEIRFPRLVGYRYETAPTRLEARFTPESRLVLSTQDLPTRTESAPIVGESIIHTLDDLRGNRLQEVAFAIARQVLMSWFPADHPVSGPVGGQVWLFPQILAITRRWLDECVTCKDNVFPQLLMLAELGHSAAEKIHRAIVAASPEEARIRAIAQTHDTLGTPAIVSFDSCRDRWRTREDKCHINYAVLDSDWERHFAQTLEEMPEVRAYVKNDHLGFKIPYTHEGQPGNYYPDYLVRVDDGQGDSDLLTLVVEMSGQTREQKEAKVDTAQKMWVPAVNAERTWGRWAFLEIRDPLTAQSVLREFLAHPG